MSKKIGIGMAGSFCSIEKSLKAIEKLDSYDKTFILSDHVYKEDSRFMTNEVLIHRLEVMTNYPIYHTIHEAEAFGSKDPLDMLVVVPCDANTINKLANGIFDNGLMMAIKSTLRNNHPIVLCVFTNDGLSTTGSNLMKLLNTKNIYVVPFGQDDPNLKPSSIASDLSLLEATMVSASNHIQYQPVLISYG